MTIILNEKEYAEKILEQKRLSRKPSHDLKLLAKYYYHEKGLKPNQIYEKLVKIMEQKYYNFSISKWQDLLLDLGKKAKKNPPIQIDYIPVAENELTAISDIQSKPMKRVAFTLLCLAKYRNLVNPKNNDWVNYEFKDVFKIGNVTATIREQCFMISDMKELGLLHMNKMVDNLSMQICFIDRDNSREVLQIKDFRNLGYEYLLYCGEDFIRCKSCGILVRQNRTKSRLYCKDCLEYRSLENKVIQCMDCGVNLTIVPKDNKSLRCPDCYKKYRTDYCRIKKREFRSKNQECPQCKF